MAAGGWHRPTSRGHAAAEQQLTGKKRKECLVVPTAFPPLAKKLTIFKCQEWKYFFHIGDVITTLVNKYWI